MAKREKLWVVRPGDGGTVGEIIARAKEDASAIADGRVFVGKRRATRVDDPVRPGDAVRIGAKRETEARIEILLEENGIVACVKPAGLPTVPDQAGASHALVALVAQQIGARDLRVTSRLDRDVSGVVFFALDAVAEDRLRAARAEGTYHRRYLAIASVPARAPVTGGEWNAAIGRATNPLLRAVDGPDAKAATTRWRALAQVPGYAVLEALPVTGRTHQIRLHASHAGMPLLGDRAYGGPGRITLPNGRVLAPSRIALHAARVEVLGLVAEAPFPHELVDLWTALGGAWESPA